MRKRGAAYLGLESVFEIQFEPGGEGLVALAHPRRLLLDVGEIDPVQIVDHLVDLSRVLEDGPGGLCQMIEGGVSPQCLRESNYRSNLKCATR